MLCVSLVRGHTFNALSTVCFECVLEKRFQWAKVLGTHYMYIEYQHAIELDGWSVLYTLYTYEDKVCRANLFQANLALISTTYAS